MDLEADYYFAVHLESLRKLLVIRIQLERVSRPYQLRLVEEAADELDADGQLAGEAARHGNRRNAREVDGHCIHVRHVHGQGILSVLADLECREGHRGGREHVHVLERALEVLLDERPYPEGLKVISAIIAFGQGIGTE